MSAPNVNKMGRPFYFHTSRVRLKRKYLFRSRKKEIIILHSTKAHVVVQYNKMAAKAKVRLKLLDVFEDLNNSVDMNGSIDR